jgi:hypothetical protein
MVPLDARVTCDVWATVPRSATGTARPHVTRHTRPKRYNTRLERYYKRQWVIPRA